MTKTSYAIAMGSNRRHGRHGRPAAVLRAAADLLSRRGFEVERMSTIRTTPALGPAGRDFANAVLVLATNRDPPSTLAELKRVERSFGRRRGRRWGPRVLDLDIVLWTGGSWSSPGLSIPHRSLRERLFVLEPLAEVAPAWRHPQGGETMRQRLHRRRRPRPVDRERA